MCVLRSCLAIAVLCLGDALRVGDDAEGGLELSAMGAAQDGALRRSTDGTAATATLTAEGSQASSVSVAAEGNPVPTIGQFQGFELPYPKPVTPCGCEMSMEALEALPFPTAPPGSGGSGSGSQLNKPSPPQYPEGNAPVPKMLLKVDQPPAQPCAVGSEQAAGEPPNAASDVPGMSPGESEGGITPNLNTAGTPPGGKESAAAVLEELTQQVDRIKDYLADKGGYNPEAGLSGNEDINEFLTGDDGKADDLHTRADLKRLQKELKEAREKKPNKDDAKDAKDTDAKTESKDGKAAGSEGSAKQS
eukprot:TRINITY_DN100417_c0_g1_i1.p1 TRINITY_DN100417_c0_g1~~TRINITY_DN100417_c0_g1_i1.p1  ORF type:complete len:305 (+),score=68.11 TRINITY_DN100417_c0_g1_i1:112-1026(+)